MYHKILVPLDGSELAEVVFDYVKEIAGNLSHADVTLLHVSEPESGEFAPMHQAYVQRAAERIAEDVRKIQARKGIPQGGQPARITGEVAVGYPAEEVLKYVDAQGVDLIILAAHGRSGVRRWIIGSVADKVLRASKVPALLVRAGMKEAISFEKWPKISVIAPLDGSELAETVLPHVQSLAKLGDDRQVEVVLLRVCELPVTPSYYAPELSGVPLNWGELMQKETQRCKEEAEEYLGKITAQIKEGNFTVRTEVLIGKAADMIVEYVNKTPLSVVVVATHGRSGIGRMVYGSVAANILQGVNSPVLLIKPASSKNQQKKKGEK